MKYIPPFFIALTMTLPALGQAPATQPATQPATVSPAGAASAPDPLLGKLFRNSIEGIELNPPGGGTMIRDLQSGDLVRFIYTASGWDVRVRPVVTFKKTPLTSPSGDGGILEMMATQLTKDNPTAKILTQKVTELPVGMGANGPNNSFGLIEARYKAGTDVIFAQEAIIEDEFAPQQHFFVIQMSSPGHPADADAKATDAPDAKETEARRMFQHVIASVKVLDRSKLRREQQERIFQTQLLWVDIDRSKLEKAIIPEHFARVIHDGQDIGFVQIDERVASHNGHDGIEYIVHSRVENAADAVNGAAHAQAGVEPPAAGQAANNIVVPKGVAAPTAAPAAVKPTNLFTESTYFVSFNRKHEDWVITTQTDQQLNSQVTEMGNSDFVDRVVLDPEKMKKEMAIAPEPGVKHEKAAMTTVSDGSLDVAQYSQNRPLGKPVNVPYLPPHYLPQALGQMLPRLLPNETGMTNPGKYLFGSYVSSQKNVMSRYVDVGRMQDVVLDDKPVQAVPISDRVGADGIPTIHYVTRDGQWLGSVNEDAKLVVLPADEKKLAAIWRSDPRGFKVAVIPPLAEDQLPSKTEKTDHAANRRVPPGVMPNNEIGR